MSELTLVVASATVAEAAQMHPTPKLVTSLPTLFALIFASASAAETQGPSTLLMTAPSGICAQLDAAAKAAGESCMAYIRKAVEERMAREHARER